MSSSELETTLHWMSSLLSLSVEDEDDVDAMDGEEEAAAAAAVRR